MNDILTQNASAIERICKTHRVRQLVEQFMGLKEDLEDRILQLALEREFELIFYYDPSDEAGKPRKDLRCAQ
jgi:hypothetical protein